MISPNRSFDEKLLAYKQVITRFMASLLTQDRPVSLYDPIRYALEGGGKRLRPILLLLTTETLNGDVEQAIPAASAVEILHNFTLVHDDIMDNDSTRRGRPTLHSRWGVDVALLAGDGLVALAYQSLMRMQTAHLTQVCRLFTEGIVALCEGQALDKEFEQRERVSMREYMEMITKKTGCLLGLCAHIGGVLANGSNAEVEALRIYGQSLGIAFQIQDDVLDITSEQEVIGKDFGSDVRSRKKTFLLVYALEFGTPRQQKRILDELSKSTIGLPEILHVRELFEEIGTLQAAQRQVEHYIEKAKQQLAFLENRYDTHDLESFLQLIVDRRF